MRVEGEPHKGDVVVRGRVDRGAAFAGADVAAGVADFNAVGAEFIEGFRDGGFFADAVDDEIPFFGSEFFGDAESDAAAEPPVTKATLEEAISCKQ